MDRAVLETASDRYVIVEYLAEGGMGAIYLGKKLGVDGFEKEVVLKQLLPEFTREPKFIDLFLREARLSASLDHANVVRTVDLVNAGDDYFMVMEYVRGGDLRTLMRRARRRHKKFPPGAALFIAHELLEALGYAHDKTGLDGQPLGLIHRDVSPSNILLSGAGEVKLTDFGIAKASTHASVFYKVRGKVGYMSPEQARGEPVDKRTDLFSLAVVLYEVLVGERLFVGDLLSSAAMVYSQKITPPSKKRPEVPEELDAVVLKALSLDPRGRYQSAEELQDALQRVAARHRLIIGASEMASHLKQVCGEDPGTWLKLETLASGFDESQALSRTHGTAVLSSAEMSADEDDPFDDSAPHVSRPLPQAALQKKELTSVIALRAEDLEPMTGESTAVPLKPLSPGRSEPITHTPSHPTHPLRAQKPSYDGGGGSFVDEESQASRAATMVRTPERERHDTPTGAPTRVRESQPGSGGGTSASRAQPGSGGGTSASRARTTSGVRAVASLGVRGAAPSASPRAAQPASPSWDDPTRQSTQRARANAAAEAEAAAAEEPSRASSHRRLGGVPNDAALPPLVPATWESNTDSMRKLPSRRSGLLPAIIVLLLVGLGVAFAVAFSGPELDVPDEPAPHTQGGQPGHPPNP